MKKKSMFMLALGSLAVAALAKPAMRKADEIIRRRRGETLSGLPATMAEEDMQAVAQESSVVADGTLAHRAAPRESAARKDGDLAPPVGA
ncbi:hypothetical protein [Herbaspirillum robiniae]|uniref:DUF4148 domain-containing protein n=1 Tax=Herbaspirillum robiniae TaxID=2014887 RepID=A0A246WN23_9BURK|nr:hypothetical protein [Herbaspirillum robiniae]NUU03108.1 hypothetical protein [Herbaspirillum robiniae]OWY27764.1 hypothetical protein CEJ42_16880 [Herbaspirillum robiniae]